MNHNSSLPARKTFRDIFDESDVILTEGAISERLKSEFGLKMDRSINHAGIQYSHHDILLNLYKLYIDIAVEAGLPVMIMTPTRKVNVESLMLSEYYNKPVIKDAVTMLQELRRQYTRGSNLIHVGGLLGCRGNAYSGRKLMDIDPAYKFHSIQAQIFANEHIDFLFAGIMPEIKEAMGMALALAETSVPYIISFMINPNGCLLDGTPIKVAIKKIDALVSPKPICYAVNCIHPSNLIKALQTKNNTGLLDSGRLTAFQANASDLSPEELDGCQLVKQDDFCKMVENMVTLKNEFGFKILGGCCGTDDVFLQKLAQKISMNYS